MNQNTATEIDGMNQLLSNVSQREGLAIETDEIVLEGWVGPDINTPSSSSFVFIPTDKTLEKVQRWYDGDESLGDEGILVCDGSSVTVDWDLYDKYGSYTSVPIGDVASIERRYREQIGQRGLL